MALDRFRQHKANPDYVYITLAAILVLFGFVMIASSSAVLSVEIYNQHYSFVIRQLIGFTLGLTGAIIASRIPYEAWRTLSKPFLLTVFLLLLVVFIPGVGRSAKGAARWIDLGLFQLQPSELLKLAYILYLAAWFENRGDRLRDVSQGLIPFLLLMAPGVLLLMWQRDLGTLLVILVTCGFMFFVSGVPYTQILAVGAVGVVLVGLLIAIEPYRMDRFTTFLRPSEDKLGDGYHINQAMLAVGSGGFWGRGYGNSLQKYLYLPEPHTDSIFAITVEELGLLRSLLVIGVIGLLGYRGYQIAFRAQDNFARMVAFGITTWLLFQALINLGAILGLVPLTGVPLPLISYGGTSLIACLVSIGIVAGISRYAQGK